MAKPARRILDSDGAEVTAGCCLSFSYGIPPVGVCAHVVERDGRLIALTPGHNPEETPVRGLRRYIGDFYIRECRCAIGRLDALFASRSNSTPEEE